MSVVSIHSVQFIVSLYMSILTAFTSPVAAMAEPEKRALSNKVMNDPTGLKRTKEKEASFLKALNDHQGIIHKICHIYCNHRSDQADLFQEIVCQLWRAYPSFQNKSMVSTWMYSVALKTAMVPYQKCRTPLEFREVLPEISTMTEPDSTQIELLDFFQKLNSIDRAIITFLIEGYSRKEISAAVGISADAVRMRLGRLRVGMDGDQ